MNYTDAHSTERTELERKFEPAGISRLEVRVEAP